MCPSGLPGALYPFLCSGTCSFTLAPSCAAMLGLRGEVLGDQVPPGSLSTSSAAFFPCFSLLALPQSVSVQPRDLALLHHCRPKEKSQSPSPQGGYSVEEGGNMAKEHSLPRQTSHIRLISQFAMSPSQHKLLSICPSSAPAPRRANNYVGEGLLDLLGIRNCLSGPLAFGPKDKVASSSAARGTSSTNSLQSPACSVCFCRCHLQVPALSLPSRPELNKSA